MQERRPFKPEMMMLTQPRWDGEMKAEGTLLGSDDVLWKRSRWEHNRGIVFLSRRLMRYVRGVVSRKSCSETKVDVQDDPRGDYVIEHNPATQLMTLRYRDKAGVMKKEPVYVYDETPQTLNIVDRQKRYKKLLEQVEPPDDDAVAA